MFLWFVCFSAFNCFNLLVSFWLYCFYSFGWFNLWWGYWLLFLLISWFFNISLLIYFQLTLVNQYVFNLGSVIFIFYIFCCINTTFRVNFFKELTVTRALWWGWLGFHPIVLYTSIFIFIIYIYYFRYGLGFIKVSLNWILFFSTCAFFSGSFWSLMNLVWGFFWVGDIIEILLFIFLMWGFFFQHQRFLLYINFDILIFFCFLILSFFLLRFGMFSTRHSFFINITFKHYLILVYLCWLQLSFFFFKRFLCSYLFFCGFFIVLVSLNYIVAFLIFLIFLSFYSLFSTLFYHLCFFFIVLFVSNHTPGYYFFYFILVKITSTPLTNLLLVFDSFVSRGFFFYNLVEFFDFLEVNKLFFATDLSFFFYNYFNFLLFVV